MADSSPFPRTSLVTTVLNDRAGTVLFFQNMEAQRRLPDEIVVVDGGSTDGTWEVLQSHHSGQGVSIKALQVFECNVARGRNLAIAAATHELIVSTDVGCSWEPDWLLELVRPFEQDPDCEAVMGSWAVRPEELQGPWALTEFVFLRAPKMVAAPDSHASSRSIAYTKTLWKRIGGYPEDLTLAGDDMVFALLLHRTSRKTGCSSALLCYWERPNSLKAFGKEARRNFKGAGEAGIWLKYGVKVGLRFVVEAGCILAGIVFLLPSFRSWILGLIFFVGLVSILLRLIRLKPAVRAARALGINYPVWRLIAFEYLTKIQAVRGYREGFFRGRRQCVDCRTRLRAAGVQH